MAGSQEDRPPLTTFNLLLSLFSISNRVQQIQTLPLHHIVTYDYLYDVIYLYKYVNLVISIMTCKQF
jgi:hypothetical protein